MFESITSMEIEPRIFGKLPILKLKIWPALLLFCGNHWYLSPSITSCMPPCCIQSHVHYVRFLTHSCIYVRYLKQEKVRFHAQARFHYVRYLTHSCIYLAVGKCFFDALAVGKCFFTHRNSAGNNFFSKVRFHAQARSRRRDRSF